MSANICFDLPCFLYKCTGWGCIHRNHTISLLEVNVFPFFGGKILQHFRLWNWSFASKKQIWGIFETLISQSMLAGEIIWEQCTGSGSSKRAVRLRNLILLPRWLDFIHKRSLLAVWTLSFATTGHYLALKEVIPVLQFKVG